MTTPDWTRYEVGSEADEADLIEQATAVPLGDDDGFDR